MKQFIVSMFARSRHLGLDAIARLLGAEPDGGHDRGQLDDRGDRCYLDAFWWVDSRAGDAATIAGHAAALAGRVAPVVPDVADRVAAGDLELSIGVGIMYDTYTTSVRLPRELVALAARLGAAVEVSSYPTDFAEEEEAAAS